MNRQEKKIGLKIMNAPTSEKKDWWDELSTEQLSAISEAEAELDAGKGIPHNEVLEKLNKWL